MEFEFRGIERESLECIQPLWDQLRLVHLADSRFFKEYYRRVSFEERCEKFLVLPREDVFVEGVFLVGGDRLVGYCVATVDRGGGEIDSLFVDEAFRGRGFGGLLVEHSVRWLKERGCVTIRVGVGFGHESVFGFYERLGFFPRMTYLQLKEGSDV